MKITYKIVRDFMYRSTESSDAFVNLLFINIDNALKPLTLSTKKNFRTSCCCKISLIFCEKSI